MKNKTLVLVLLLIITFSAVFYFMKGKKQKVKNEIPNTEVLLKKNLTSNHLNKTFKWSELNIKPIKSIEGSDYTFTAFEIIKNELVIAGNFNNKNIIRFLKNEKISNLEIQDTPLDLLFENSKLYVLCFNHIYIIENEKLIQSISISIPTITTYEKLIFFDNAFNILMSDGSSFQLIDDKLIKHNSLTTKNNTELWVQKTSTNSFEIKTKPTNQKLNRTRKYNTKIGAITLIGNSSDNYYCVIEIIENTQPISIKRIISSNTDNFEETQFTLPQQNYSYIKNDYKIHNNILYTVSINKTGLTLNSHLL